MTASPKMPAPPGFQGEVDMWSSLAESALKRMLPAHEGIGGHMASFQ
jgi:hypothetical protein